MSTKAHAEATIQGVGTFLHDMEALKNDAFDWEKFKAEEWDNCAVLTWLGLASTVPLESPEQKYFGQLCAYIVRDMYKMMVEFGFMDADYREPGWYELAEAMENAGRDIDDDEVVKKVGKSAH